MEPTLNTELLAGMIKDKRGERGLRAVADEIGNVSFVTLSRIEQGKLPDVDTYIRLCSWLNVSTDTFINKDSNKKLKDELSVREEVVAHLRADRTLSQDTSDALIKMINIAYEHQKG